MSTLETTNRLRLSFHASSEEVESGARTGTKGGTRSVELLAREPLRLAFAGSVVGRAARTGSEPGRSSVRARRVTPAISAKHSQLVRRCLSEPTGEFDRCLSIALGRMIDAVDAEMERAR